MRRLVLHWVCVLALVALPVGGCSDETTATGGSGGVGGMAGGGGGAPEFGAGSAFSWFTGDSEEADRLCGEWCDTEGCAASVRIGVCALDDDECIEFLCPDGGETCIASLCVGGDEACVAEQCRLGCRRVLAGTCGESIAKDRQCEIEKGTCDGYPPCPPPSDAASFWRRCEGQLIAACNECPGCEDDINALPCDRAGSRCWLSAGNCDADTVTSLCEKWDRAGQLECSVDRCFEGAEENPLVPRCGA